MGWLKNLFGVKQEPSSEIEIFDGFNLSPQEKIEQAVQKQLVQEDAQMKEIQEERDATESAVEGQLLVIDGAKIKMNGHTGTFKVLQDVPTTQGKLTGTKVEKQIPNFIFDDGFQLLSIDGEWQSVGSLMVQENPVLIKDSTISVSGKMPGNSPIEKGLISFTDSGQVNEPEEVAVNDGAPVPSNKIDDNFDISVLNNGTSIDPGSFVFITAEPAMPKLRLVISKGKDCVYKQLYFRLKIEFKFTAQSAYSPLCDRNDISYFPISVDKPNSFIAADKIGTNYWDVDFKELFRGGTATVEVWDGNKSKIIDTFIFYIRGKNPTKQAVKQYMTNVGYLTKYWFIYRMVLSESGSESGALMRQFWDPEFVGKGSKRKEAIYGASGRGIESKGIPNYGYPDGWGMSQIDFKYEKSNPKHVSQKVKDVISNPNYIWNWKDNLRVMIEIKLQEKIATAVKHLKKILDNSKEISSFSIKEGDIVYKTCPSTIPELEQFNSQMLDSATLKNERSILDAEVIKLYNGGHYISGFSSNGQIDINRLNSLNFNYNERVGSVKE